MKNKLYKDRKTELALQYYQERCKELEKECEECRKAKVQLANENDALKKRVTELESKIDDLSQKADKAVSTLRDTVIKLKDYQDKYNTLIKETRIVMNRQAQEHEALKKMIGKTTT